MRNINIKLSKQTNGSESSIFAFSDEAIEPSRTGPKQKILGNGSQRNFSEVHNDLFNLSKSRLNDEDVTFFINGEEYATSLKNSKELSVNDSFPKDLIKEFSPTKTIELELDRDFLGNFSVSRKDGENLYKMEDSETLIRDKNGLNKFQSKAEALDAVRYYFTKEDNINTYNVPSNDFIEVKVNGEKFNEYFNRESTLFNFDQPEMVNKTDNKLRNTNKM